MAYVIHGWEPEDALHYFEDLCKIPHGSGNEQEISDYLLHFFQNQGLTVKQDSMGNLYARKEGSAGCENLPAILLQGHMDMVCEKNSDTIHDFEKDPLQLVVDGHFLRANGTTLGADDGVAIAYMMTIAARKDLVHPPVEMLITVQEETGLDGAAAVDPSFFTAKQMINLDESPEGFAFVSCSGGLQVKSSKHAKQIPAQGQAVSIKIRGLLGGHSGNDINAGRANSNKLMARALMALLDEFGPYSLVHVCGGSKPNAIPREADALVVVPDADKACQCIHTLEEQIKAEIGINEKAFSMTASSEELPQTMLDAQDCADFIRLFFLLPEGIQTYSMVMQDHTDCSLNTGVVETEGGTLSVLSSIRSAVATQKHMVARQIQELCNYFGAQYEMLSEYPGWAMAEHSPIRDLVCQIYQEQTGKEMAINITHGGLESGLLADKMPGMDIIAIGPTNHEFHTPNEHLDLDSFARTFDLILRVLASLAGKE